MLSGSYSGAGVTYLAAGGRLCVCMEVEMRLYGITATGVTKVVSEGVGVEDLRIKIY